MKLAPSPVKALALSRGLPVRQPATLKTEAGRADILAFSLDVLVVAAYGLILPRVVLDWPRHGCINIHASLLPRWRGAAPIQSALLEGDRETGITIMQMDEGLDTGPVISRVVVPMAPRETASTLHDKLAAAGARAITEVLGRLQREGRLESTAQAEAGATYATKIDRHKALIDWRRSAPAIDRVIRAYNPVPGAYTAFDGAPLKIWAAEPAPGRFGAPGAIVRAEGGDLVVACGEGALIVRELQRAGGKRLSAAAFLAGHPVATNARFGGADG